MRQILNLSILLVFFTWWLEGQSFDMSGSVNVVTAVRSGQRIDNYLFAHLKGVPKGLVYRLLRTGKIRVNGKRVKQTYRVQEDDEIQIPHIDVAQSLPVIIKDKVKQTLSDAILFENNHILAINKPAGLAVHPGSKVAYGVIEVLRALRPNADFLELVHRLDRETSGCLLLAKDKPTLNELHELLRNHDIYKNYLLLVKGEWDLGQVDVDIPLPTKGQDAQYDESKNTVKQAITHFKPLKLFNGFSLLNANIKTGRTHQIRIHAAQTGFPVVGDSRYGDFAFNRECKKIGLKRMFLHAKEISFSLASTLQTYKIVAPLPDELKTFIEGLDL